ncbi:MAG: glutathione-disulfide reductase [Pseudomonadota bacterium]
MTQFDYDLMIIGAGSGGVRAARMAASYGAKVAIAEDSDLGGTCVNLGCVPKKLFVYASQFSDHFSDSQGFGWSKENPTFDWHTLLKNKNREISRISGAYQNILNTAGAELIRERAVFENPHTIKLLASGKTLRAKHILVAPGSKPFVPDIPGKELAITSNDAFHLDTLPASIVIVGGGYIAVEFACIFHGLGVETTLLYRGEKILRGFDEDMRDKLQEEMNNRGISLHLNTNPTQLSQQDGKYHVALNTGTTLTTDLVMYATGRIPNTQNLGLEKVGVALGRKGEILVDDYYKTSVDHIYAVGDVIDRIALTPVALREGAAVAETLFNNTPTQLNYNSIPTAVFSQPEIGVVGLTEAQAREKYKSIDIYKSDFRPLKYIIADRNTKMLMKLIVDGESKKILGCHMIGDAAAEIVQIVATVIRMGGTKTDLDETVALHPSSSEELVTMKQKWSPAV